jgi:hypothetical protein
MNILSLNYRGLGLEAAVGEVRDLIRSYNPAVVFLCETKQKKKIMDRLQWSLGFRHGVCVEGKGKGGGLALWWRGSCPPLVSVFYRCKNFYGHWFVEVLGHLWRTKNGAERENMGGCAVLESPR